MEVGKLNKRIELQSLTSSRNAFGEQIDTYSTYATVWAQIRPMRGVEQEQTDKVSAKVEYKITIRYNSDITERGRIVYDSRTFEIVGILNLFERNSLMELYCNEVK